MHMPPTVLMAVMQSAPPSTQALAISPMFGTSGDSFTEKGSFVASLTAPATDAASSIEEENILPSLLTLGQEMFTSIMAGFASDILCATSAKSFTEPA